MNLWDKIFNRNKAKVDQDPKLVEQSATRQDSASPTSLSGSTSAQSEAELQNRTSRMLWEVKRPRYAHMAKHHELLGELADADYNYNMLCEGQRQIKGDSHPDFATALYELASLNHHYEIEHTPDVQIIYNTMGRGAQVYMFYSRALEIRKSALGEEHPAYAQSLYGLATLYKQNHKEQEALAMLNQALKVQNRLPDPLPSARTILCLAEITGTEGNRAEAIKLYQQSLELLALPSKNWGALERAAQYCKEARVDPNSLEVDAQLVDKALSLQSNLVNPYYL